MKVSHATYSVEGMCRVHDVNKLEDYDILLSL